MFYTPVQVLKRVQIQLFQLHSYKYNLCATVYQFRFLNIIMLGTEVSKLIC